jgi:hypothetical protein
MLNSNEQSEMLQESSEEEMAEGEDLMTDSSWDPESDDS